MAKRKTKCVFCGQRDIRKWLYCSRCGRRYHWQRPMEDRMSVVEGWKQIAALCLLALFVMAIIG